MLAVVKPAVTDYPIQNPKDTSDIEDELTIPDDTGREHSTARWLALQILYEIDCTDHPQGEVMTNHLNRYSLQPATRDYTYQLVNGVLANLERLDMIVQTVAQEHPLDHLAIVDRNLLRSAVYEFTMLDAPPPIGIVADEAVRLAKEFGSDNAPPFVNGVLGTLYRNQPRLQAMLEAEIPPDDDEEDFDFDEENYFDEDDDA